MKKKKLFSIVGVILILSMILAGCANTSNGSKDGAGNTTTPSATPTNGTDNNDPDPTDTPTPTEEANTATPNTPVGYHGEMVVKDGKIYGSKSNQIARVTGMSMFWSCWSQKYYTAAYVDQMVDEFGCEILRCAYGIQDNGVPHSPSDEKLIEDVINECIKKGVYVILDWHSHGAHNNPEESIKFFSKMAEKYGKYDNVIFELFNEPTQIQWSVVKEYAEKVIPEIRKYSDNLILVGNPQWCQKIEDPANDPISDPNVAYTLHFYAGTHTQWLRDSADRAMSKGIAIFVSEWGSVNADGNGSIAEQSTKDWFEWIDKNQLSSCNWAVNDKNEGSSIFVKDNQYSETGKYIMALIKERTDKSPWKK